MATAFRQGGCGCAKRKACQCTPLVLHTWRGTPGWSSNDIRDFGSAGDDWLDRIAAQQMAGTQYQWRITHDLERKDVLREYMLTQQAASIVHPGEPPYGWGGPVRDGKLIGLPGPLTAPSWWAVGGFDHPWRLEIGCVRCRCRGTRQIFWPIRHDWTTTPVYDNGAIVDVNQTQARVADDYGRSLTNHESSRDYWWGDLLRPPVAESRPCPPTEIRWWHALGQDATSVGWAYPQYGVVQDQAGHSQVATGWHSTAYAGGVAYRETFHTVNISDVNRITLLQPPADVTVLGGFADPPADPDSITDAEIDALVAWLDDGPPRLLTISGAGGFRDRMNDFLSRFCNLRIAYHALAIYPTWDPMLNGYSHPLTPGAVIIDGDTDLVQSQNPRYVARNHPLVTYPQTINLPANGLSGADGLTRGTWYPGTSGGDVLYDIEYEYQFATKTFPAVTMETRPNGSRIVLAPQWGYLFSSFELQKTWSPFDLVNVYSSGKLSHSDPLLKLYPPTVPRNASTNG